MEIGDEGRQGLVQHGPFLFQPAKVVVVGVPASGIDFHIAYTLLHQASSQQTALTEGVVTIGRLLSLRFLADVKGVQFLALHQAHGVPVHVGIGPHCAGVVSVQECLVLGMGSFHPFVEAVLGHTPGEFAVL